MFESIKNFKFSLKYKIAFLFILLVIVMMAVVTYIYTIRELNLRVEQVKLRMERLANNIATIRSVESEDWSMYQTYIDNQIKLNPDIVYIAIFDELDELKVHAINFDWVDVDTSRSHSRLEQQQIVLRLDQRQIAPESQKDMESKSVNIIIGDQNLGTVKVGFSLVQLNDEMSNNLSRNLKLAIIFILLTMIVSYFISYRIVTPLGRLTSAMLKISQGDLRQELHIKSHDEIGEMAETFNYMTKGLQEKELIENFGRELGFTIELEKITSLITNRISQALNATQGFLFLRTKNEHSNFNLVCEYPQPLYEHINISRQQNLCHYFLNNRNPQQIAHMIDQSMLCEQLQSMTWLGTNALIAPIIIKEDVLGIFVLNDKQDHLPYKDGEKNFLGTLINQSALAIESTLLYEELTEQERLKRELEIARMVQLGLLPQENPALPGLDISGICLPAEEIGGDYYDYFFINEHTIGIAIADVTGKGTSAAFYMAVIKGMMLSLATMIASPKELLCALNQRLYGKMDKKVFVTMIYALLNLKKMKLTFARAGHNALIMRKAEKSVVECFTPMGIGLGLDSGQVFENTITEQNINLHSGDTFVFYTDGISEAMNENKEEFGDQRLIEIITKTNHCNASFLQKNIIEEVNKFVKDTPQHDDITMVSVIVT